MKVKIIMALNFAKNPESALNVGKAVNNLKNMANAKKAASEIKKIIIY